MPERIGARFLQRAETREPLEVAAGRENRPGVTRRDLVQHIGGAGPERAHGFGRRCRGLRHVAGRLGHEEKVSKRRASLKLGHQRANGVNADQSNRSR
jgi:hypothetical protein